MADPTLTPPQRAAVDEVEAQIARGVAALAEGFCPFCHGALRSLTPDEQARCAGWFAPPSAACEACRYAVGQYRDGTGITIHGVQLGGYFGTYLSEMRPRVVTPSRTDRQPPTSATQAKGGKGTSDA